MRSFPPDGLSLFTPGQFLNGLTGCPQNKSVYKFPKTIGCINPRIGVYYKQEVLDMQINTNNLVSITEANQNFSRIARLVDENGAAVILKNNVPRYILMEFSQFQTEELAGTEEVDTVAKRILTKNRRAFEELAK